MRLRARAACGSLILAAFAVFFVVPVLWLILAPTKTDAALVTSSPFSFGSFHQVALAWKHLDAFSDHIYRALDRQLAALRAERDRDHAGRRRSRPATASRSASSPAASSS